MRPRGVGGGPDPARPRRRHRAPRRRQDRGDSRGGAQPGPRTGRPRAARPLHQRPALDRARTPTSTWWCEVIGGIEPARTLILEAFAAGKHVVTANKELLSTLGRELFDAAEAAKVDLYFEAAVGGGIPLIHPLKESLAGERIRKVIGIVNGTTNYILTRMTEEGVSFSEAVAQAQGLGYAERDPSADVEGYDAAAKLRDPRLDRVQRPRRRRRRLPRGDRRRRGAGHRVRRPARLRREAAGDRGARGRRDRRARPPGDDPQGAPAGRRARLVQRRVRGGRERRRADVLRAGGRRRADGDRRGRRRGRRRPQPGQRRAGRGVHLLRRATRPADGRDAQPVLPAARGGGPARRAGLGGERVREQPASRSRACGRRGPARRPCS